MLKTPNLLVPLLVIFFTAACGETSEPCGTPRQEPPDPASGLHVLDEEIIDWPDDPPTSGPHRAVVPAGGLRQEPIDPLDQVAFLEAGGVVIQVDSPQVPKELAALAHSDVIIAPRPGLPDAVVATAWTWRLRCSSLDSARLRSFISRRVGIADGH